ncbi:MAG: RNA polymerase sigma factor [Polyangiaceae bacterium]
MTFVLETTTQVGVVPRPAALAPSATALRERAIHARHADAIYRFLCDMLGQREDAADATQETFIRAFRQLATLREPSKEKAWLFGIARNVAREHYRARARRRDGLAAAPRPEEGGATDPEGELIGRQTAEALRRTLRALPSDRRSAFLMRVDHALAYRDIAAALGWTVAKAKVEVHRARKKLERALMEVEDGA